MPRPRKNITLDFAAIDTALNAGQRLDLKRIAAQHSTCPPVIRRILSEHYGDKITFKPGRNGGIQLATPTTSDTVVSEYETVSVA
jgi:DNA-binding IscR family transcriptional regulator